jgi:hypothetical protein
VVAGKAPPALRALQVLRDARAFIGLSTAIGSTSKGIARNIGVMLIERMSTADRFT